VATSPRIAPQKSRTTIDVIGMSEAADQLEGARYRQTVVRHMVSRTVLSHVRGRRLSHRQHTRVLTGEVVNRAGFGASVGFPCFWPN
jgi:hypothetical protein